MKKIILALALVGVASTAIADRYEPGHVFPSQFDHCFAAMQPEIQSKIFTRTYCVFHYTEFSGTW